MANIEVVGLDTTTPELRAATSGDDYVMPFGRLGLGGAAQANEKVVVRGLVPSASAFSIIYSNEGTVPSTTTTMAIGFYSAGTTQAASFTLNEYQHFRVWQGGFGAGSTVNNQYGFYVASNLTGATNNYAFYSALSSGTNRWNVYMAGNAPNFFWGSVGIGDTGLTNVKLRVRGSNTASSDYAAYFENSAASPLFYVQNDGTSVFGSAALATTATAGFIWIPSCAGAPTGAPTAPYTNAAALVTDTTNNRLYVRVGSTWRYATLT